MKTLLQNKKHFHVNTVKPEQAQYDLLSNEVSKRYFKTYKANINPKPDLFINLTHALFDKKQHGACYGINLAKNRTLFSEQYLNQSAENTLLKHCGIYTTRPKIAELGSLAAYQLPGAGKILFEMSPWLSWSMGIEYILITATSKVREIMAKSNILFQSICQADVNRLDHAKSKWGSYYDTNPLTGFIDVKASLSNQLIQKNLNKYGVAKPSKTLAPKELLYTQRPTNIGDYYNVA